MAEVALIDLGYCKVERFLAFSMSGPSLESSFENWDPSVKVERASLWRYEKSICVTSAILISKVQPCPTSSGPSPSDPRQAIKPGTETVKRNKMKRNRNETKVQSEICVWSVVFNCCPCHFNWQSNHSESWTISQVKLLTPSI